MENTNQSEKRYTSKTMGALAERACVDRATFQKWLTQTDLKYMLDLGWNPFANMLPPSVVKYLEEKFITGKHMIIQ